ncbi:hypothetical protein BD324DRAFT_582578 [Kockovaella imperatae]|uniref:DUF1275 domain protein n=1 Tax=Kockovaella imperatae TaxID=4999 RepID=A0A1Y1UC83_9TREE|nr:hypothetical protein BD324DRAFT_582578 [Kockovaella imperatae]ORX35134.1 hypothetical protein BD324DRAFT_582578 [Kockovaella imperatae]
MGGTNSGKRIRDSLGFSNIVGKLKEDVDTKQVNLASVAACFLTGFTSCNSFTACYIWCGFQTGNVAQLGLALARNLNPPPYKTIGFQKPDQQALTSLLCFILGTSLGRLGDRIGSKSRLWLMLASFTQALLCMAGALAAHFSGQSGIALEREFPSWTNALGLTALGFISASLGIQGIVGKRLGSPLNTTIVLTTTWVELANDPLLYSLKPVTSRDVRAAGVFGVFFGAFVARALLGTRCGVPGTLGILVGFRIIQMFSWLFIPAAKK